MPINDMDNKRIEFLVDVYKVRAEFHREHINRSWTRFNFMLTAETALLGVLFVVWTKDTSVQNLLTVNAYSDSFLMLRALGVFVSLLWYVLGAQDHYYFESFRKQVQSLEAIIAKELKTPVLDKFPYCVVKDVKQNLFTWRIGMISLSKMVAVFPLLFLAVWSVLLVFLHI